MFEPLTLITVIGWFVGGRWRGKYFINARFVCGVMDRHTDSAGYLKLRLLSNFASNKSGGSQN